MTNHEFWDSDDMYELLHGQSSEKLSTPRREDKYKTSARQTSKIVAPTNTMPNYDVWDSDDMYEMIHGPLDAPTPQELQPTVSDQYRK
jgi:hypothetical protein